MIPRTHLLPHLLDRHRQGPAPQASDVPSEITAKSRRVVMLQISDQPALSDAVHAACQTARRQDALLAFVVMVPVAHPSWLGTDLGQTDLPSHLSRAQRQATATAEDYGLECAVTRYQYTTWAEGTAQAAELFGATLLIAARPRRALPGWSATEAWLLRRQLSRQGCAWQEELFQGR